MVNFDMINFWNELKRPIIALAPMAGITDQPFRLICKKFGADVVFSEMVSSDAIYHQKITNNKIQITNKLQNSKNKFKNSFDIEKFEFDNYLGFDACNLGFSFLKTLNLIRFSKMERPFVTQIFGSDPEKMAFVAKYISSGEWSLDYKKITKSKLQTCLADRRVSNKFPNPKSKISNVLDIEKFEFENYFGFSACDLEFISIPDGIDINMGCPTKDIIKQSAGAALMENPKLASKIIQAIKKSTKLPVSVKTRLGWDNPKDILVFCRTLEYAGADAITIHSRTYKQGFVGEPNWEMVYQVKKLVKIPVILNGGISSIEDFQRVDLDKVDGVMIGQGALGRPWIFSALSGKNPHYQLSIINYQFLKKTILEHANLAYQLKGQQGIIEMRKHLAWYFKGMPNSKEIREKLVKVNSLGEIENLLNVN